MNPFRTRSKQPALTREAALACIPRKAQNLHWQEGAEGTVLIEYQLALKPFFLQLARRFKLGGSGDLTRKLELDELGSCAWRLIDGERDVKAIIAAFAAEQQFSTVQAEQSITLFLRELGKRGLIILV